MSASVMELPPWLTQLPTKWDGGEIEWGGWEQGPTCCWSDKATTEDKECPGCHRQGAYIVNRGKTKPQSTLIDLHTGMVFRTRHTKVDLLLMRCPGCGDTTVWDGAEYWSLDHTDYGPDGSYAK